MWRSLLIGAGVLLVSVSGCSDRDVSNISERPLVRAGSGYIYSSDLEHHLSTFENQAREKIATDPISRQKLLESIALSELMAQKREEALGDEQIEALNAAVRAYRRQRLAAEFAAEILEDSPISMKDLKAHYDSHAEYRTGDAPREFSEVVPQLRREISVLRLREQLTKERKQLNKDIEYFD